MSDVSLCFRWSIILTVKQNDCVKQKEKYICLKPVPCNQIVASVKIKIATVESPFPVIPPQTKKIRAGDLSPKKSCRGSDREKQFL